MGVCSFHYDCRAIEAAYQVDEVKQIRDQAIALEHYARLAKNIEAERQCCQIRLRAEHRAGQILKGMEKAKGRGERGDDGQFHQRSDEATAGPATLAELGISKDQSADWQRLGDIPRDQFELLLHSEGMPTTSGILAATKPQHPVDAIDTRAGRHHFPSHALNAWIKIGLFCSFLVSLLYQKPNLCYVLVECKGAEGR